ASSTGCYADCSKSSSPNEKLTLPLAARWRPVTGPLAAPPTLAARDARGGDKDAAGNPSAARHPGAAGDRRGSGDDSVRRRDAQRGQAGEAVQLVSSALLIG